MKKYGFTLIELLIVIVLLAILMTLSAKGLRYARISAKKAQAQIEMKSIETALKSYLNKYGELPVALGPDVIFTYTSSAPDLPESAAIISTLTLADDIEEGRNNARLTFLDAQGDGSNGTFRDPWGYQYRIALDTDYDGKLLINGTTLRRTVALASVGLYHLNNSSNTNDLVKSWE